MYIKAQKKAHRGPWAQMGMGPKGPNGPKWALKGPDVTKWVQIGPTGPWPQIRQDGPRWARKGPKEPKELKWVNRPQGAQSAQMGPWIQKGS